MADLIDAHCHLTDERVAASASAWIEAAKTAGVSKVRIGGLEPKDWAAQIELQKAYPNFVSTSFGLHPWLVEKYSKPEIEQILEKLDSQLPLAGAVGETGLDHFSKRDPLRFADQEFAFRAQLRMALKYELPLVLHIVKAHELAIRIIREEKASGLPMQIHSFSGSGEIAKEWIKLGAFLSFNGAILREKNQALRQTLKETPIQNVLFETDSPDQAWRADGRNEPQFVREIYQKAAQVLDLTESMLAEIVAENFARFE